MALHGEVKVNDWYIGDWYAVRKQRVAGTKDNPKYRYQCTTRFNGQVPLEFSIHHWYNDGAAMLLSLIMKHHFEHTFLDENYKNTESLTSKKDN